jgi:hypothetical protein
MILQRSDYIEIVQRGWFAVSVLLLLKMQPFSSQMLPPKQNNTRLGASRCTKLIQNRGLAREEGVAADCYSLSMSEGAGAC